MLGAGQLVVDAVQAAVRRDDAVAQDLAQPHHLERRRAALGVTGQALLRHDEQRCAGGAAQRVGEPLVQLGLVRVVGQRRGVVLGHHRDVVGADAQLGQRARQLRLLAAATGAQRTEPRSGDRRVHTVAEGLTRRPTTASTGRPILSARSPRASRMVPPPWPSTNPSRRRSLARENFESLMPLARIISVSAVAAMSPKPMMASSVRSS